jgi:hypothetical protein
MHGVRERCLQDFGWEALKGRDHWEDKAIDGMITVRWILGG